MVQDARGRSGGRSGQRAPSGNGIKPIKEVPEDGPQRASRLGAYETNPMAATKGGDAYNFVRNANTKTVGGANYQSAATDEDTLKKLRKLEVLANTDKETIETQ